MFTAKITANIQAKAKREHTPEFPKNPDKYKSTPYGYKTNTTSVVPSKQNGKENTTDHTVNNKQRQTELIQAR